MKKNIALVAAVSLFCSLLLCGSAMAGLSYQQGSQSVQGLKIFLDSSISIQSGNPICTQLTIMNYNNQPVTTSAIRIVVIDPFTGRVISGPMFTSFKHTILPDNYQTASVCSGAIGSSYINHTLACIVMIQGPETNTPVGTVQVVEASQGWGFTVK